MKQCNQCRTLIATEDKRGQILVHACPVCGSTVLAPVGDDLPWPTASRCNSCGLEPGEPHLCPNQGGEWNDWNSTCNCCPICLDAGRCGANH